MSLVRSLSSFAAAGAFLAGMAIPATGLEAASSVAKSPAAVAPRAASAHLAKAVFAGGCFWCMEGAFEGVPGVKSVVSGYSGGKESHPSYHQVSSGTTGHAESVEITYDPAKVSYEKLLDVYWHNIDPTQADGQFFDRGPQYRTVIFTIGEAQRRAALASKAKIEASKVLHAPIATRIEAFTSFWPAEEYHQDYYKKNPVPYEAYRLGSGRDRRLHEIWGDAAGGH